MQNSLFSMCKSVGNKCCIFSFVFGLFYSSVADAVVCFLPDIENCVGANTLASTRQTERPTENCSQFSSYPYSGTSKLANPAECGQCNNMWYCKCPGALTLSGNVCKCTGNTYKSGNNCLACLYPKQVNSDNTSCTCPSSIYTSTSSKAHATCETCQDGSTTYYNLNSCICNDSEGYEDYNGNCVSKCRTDLGQRRNNSGNCICTRQNEKETPKADGTCECKGGYERNLSSGLCEQIAAQPEEPEYTCDESVFEFTEERECYELQPYDGCARASNGCWIPACDEGSEMFFDPRDCQSYAGGSCHFDENFYCYAPNPVCDKSQNLYSTYLECEGDWHNWWKCIKNNSTGCYYPVCDDSAKYYDDEQNCRRYGTNEEGECEIVEENSGHPCYKPKPGKIQIVCDDYLHDYGQYSGNLGCVNYDMRLYNNDGEQIQLPQQGINYLENAELPNMPTGTYTLYYTNAVKLDSWANLGWAYGSTNNYFEVFDGTGYLVDQGTCNTQGYRLDGVQCSKKCLCTEDGIMNCIYDYVITFRHPGQYATTQIVFYPRNITSRNYETDKLSGTMDQCMNPLVGPEQWNAHAFIH